MKKLFAALIAVLLSGLINLVQAQNEPNYLCFTAVGGDASFGMKHEGDYDLPLIQYSTDKITWNNLVIDGAMVDIPEGTSVYLKGESGRISIDLQNYSHFVMNKGRISARGSVMSLIDGNGLSAEIPSNYCFAHLFSECTDLIKAPELPATKLREGCYSHMFYYCSNLTTAPELPANTLTQYCYYGMFSGCHSLTTSPELPATELDQSCYSDMFANCSSLTTVYNLPATELQYNCYNNMFTGCSKLTTAPKLPATTLAEFCYNGMFSDCSNLKKINVSFTEWDESATENWVLGVETTNGTFIAPASLSKTYGASYIPEGWNAASLVEKYDEPLEGNFLTFKAVNGDASFGLFYVENTNYGPISYEKAHNGNYELPNIQYSFDKKEWWSLDISSPDMVIIPQNDVVYLKGINN